MRKLRGCQRGERGAVSVIVAVLMAGSVLLGMCALVIDVGAMYVEREQLQSGADAAAQAVAKGCATACPTGANADADRMALAQQWAHANVRNLADHDIQVTSVCVNWGSQQQCGAPTTKLSDCIGTRPSSEKFVEVRVATKMPDGSSVLPPVFASALVRGAQGRTLTACARVTATPLTPPTPPAIWANRTTNGTNPAALWLASSIFNVNGLVHSNADLKIEGSTVNISPSIEYGTSQTINATTSVYPAPQRVAAGTPATVAVSDYAPGGPAAQAAGANYYQAPCVNGQATLSAGPQLTSQTVVYANCAVTVNGTVTVGAVVATGKILLWGSSIAVGNSSASPALVSGASGAYAIRAGGSSHSIQGRVQALNGQVSIETSQGDYACGIIGDTVYVGGSNINVTMPSACTGAAGGSGYKLRLSG